MDKRCGVGEISTLSSFFFLVNQQTLLLLHGFIFLQINLSCI